MSVDGGGGDPAAAGEAADDLYDFSGLSINDFSLLQKGLMMATAGGLSGALQLLRLLPSLTLCFQV